MVVRFLEATFDWLWTCFLRWGLQDFPRRILQYAQDARRKNEEVRGQVSLHVVDPLWSSLNPLSCFYLFNYSSTCSTWLLMSHHLPPTATFVSRERQGASEARLYPDREAVSRMKSQLGCSKLRTSSWNIYQRCWGLPSSLPWRKDWRNLKRLLVTCGSSIKNMWTKMVLTVSLKKGALAACRVQFKQVTSRCRHLSSSTFVEDWNTLTSKHARLRTVIDTSYSFVYSYRHGVLIIHIMFFLNKHFN